jgi:hypothetical protein
MPDTPPTTISELEEGQNADARTQKVQHILKT